MKKVSLFFLLVTIIFANPAHLVQKRSTHDFRTTLKRLVYAIGKRDLHIFATIDHTKSAKRAKLSLAKAKVLIFGSPKLGTFLMRQDIRSGLDLPLRILIYEKRGKTYLLYHSPQELAEMYHIRSKKLLKRVESIIKSIAKYACR